MTSYLINFPGSYLNIWLKNSTNLKETLYDFFFDVKCRDTKMMSAKVQIYMVLK
jgi:hypothetical protein